MCNCSKQTVIKKKIYDPNVQYTVIIVPTLSYIATHYNFGKGISGQGKGPHFGIDFS